MFYYTLEDWSCNPFKQEKMSLREVIYECTGLEDEEIRAIANLMIGDTYQGSEFSVTCTGKTA